MPERLVVTLEQKKVTDDGPGEISGLASFYGNVDLQDDLMDQGAFDKSIADSRAAKAKIPLLDWHGDSISRLIGSVKELRSTPLGLWFRAGFSAAPEAQAARAKAKEGHLSGVSIGYLPVQQSFKTIGEKTVRVLHEVKLLEISLTPVPANPQAQLASVKSTETTVVALDWPAFAEAMRKALDIGYEPARKAAVGVLLDGYHPNNIAADLTDGQATATAAADTGEPAVGTTEPATDAAGDTAADYAVSFLASSEPPDGALGGEPPKALVDPLTALYVGRDIDEMTRLEAEVRDALGGKP